MLEIKIGDTLKCVDCGKDFVLEQVKFDGNGEYIVCPHCDKKRDIQKYHIKNVEKANPIERMWFDTFAKEEIYKDFNCPMGNKKEECPIFTDIYAPSCWNCLFYKFELAKISDSAYTADDMKIVNEYIIHLISLSDEEQKKEENKYREMFYKEKNNLQKLPQNS
jgi:DNA-directed RNA polymerase subunit RPC12/RpoP